MPDQKKNTPVKDNIENKKKKFSKKKLIIIRIS